MAYGQSSSSWLWPLSLWSPSLRKKEFLKTTRKFRGRDHPDTLRLAIELACLMKNQGALKLIIFSKGPLLGRRVKLFGNLSVQIHSLTSSVKNSRVDQFDQNDDPIGR